MILLLLGVVLLVVLLLIILGAARLSGDLSRQEDAQRDVDHRPLL
jgi:ABC-type Na+ efflux pump permease subunit